MALSSNFRWIIVGALSIRNEKRVPDYAPAFTLDDLVNAIEGRLNSRNFYRKYSRDEARVMWCSHVEQDNEYVRFILHVGDKNVSGFSYVNLETMVSRDINKETNEGGHYSSHVLIKKIPNNLRQYLILIEKIPGVYFASVKDHFTWCCNDQSYKKVATDRNGNAKLFRAICEIDGYQSHTIREALRTGILQDIDFISYDEEFPDGLDEIGVVNEITSKARWTIRQRVTEEQARSLFGRIHPFIANLRGGRDHTKAFIRIKAANNQIKCSEIESEGDEILEQAFVQNEMVSDFNPQLPQRYNMLRQDMVRKMMAIANNLGR